MSGDWPPRKTRESPPPWEGPQLRQLHGADFTRWDGAGAHGFGSLGMHGSAVSGGLVGHDTRTCWLGAAGLGNGKSFGSHFSSGAVRFELRGELRSVGFVSVGAEGTVVRSSAIPSSYVTDFTDPHGHADAAGDRPLLWQSELNIHRCEAVPQRCRGGLVLQRGQKPF